MIYSRFYSSKINQTNIVVVLSVLFILFCFLGLASFGHFSYLPTITTHYDKLAVAFSHGSLALEEQPNLALLALNNPFDRSKWTGINVPIDYSLYKGKYYFYFGPVPAIILTIAKSVGIGTIGDQYPAFGFICGAFLMQVVLLTWIWKHYFASLPTWLLSLGVIFVGLISPYPYILTRARSYEAASAGGQFFFLLGIYFLLTSQAGEKPSTWKFLFAGTSWVLAMGCRATLILPMIIATAAYFIIEYKSYSNHRQFSHLIYPFIIAIMPFILGIGALGWYNWARFSSVFETGLYYQLSGPDIQKYYDQLFSPIYILPNAYNYILNQPILNPNFPLLRPNVGIGQTLFPFIQLPEIYRAGRITGILYSTPFVLFVGALFIPFKPTQLDETNNKRYDLKRIAFLFLCIFLAEFIPFAAFFWTDTRYIADFMPPLALLSIMGFWNGYKTLQNKKIEGVLYLILGTSLFTISILAGVALGIQAHNKFFKQFNPDLWKAMFHNFYPELWRYLYSILTL